MDDTGTAPANPPQPDLPGSEGGGRDTAFAGALLGFALLVLIGGGILLWRAGNNPAPNEPAAAAQPAEEWPAHTLLYSYEQNEVKADQDFKGRRLLVSGTVGKIGKDIFNTPYITLDEESEGIRSVQAFFSDSESNQLADLHRGQTIKVIGTCEGEMMNVLLKNSVIKSVGP